MALVEARGLAVQAGTGDAEAKSALPDALARVSETSKAVDAAEAQTGAQLETTKLWRELKATIATATAPQPTAQQAFDAYQPAVDGALGLVVQVANGSNLILDPDLDTYYLMDTLITKLPTAADQAGRSADLARIVEADGTMDQRVALASATDSLKATLTLLETGLNTAFEKTARTTLRSELSPGLKALAADPTTTAVAALEAKTNPGLDALLKVRVDKLAAARTKLGRLRPLARARALPLPRVLRLRPYCGRAPRGAPEFACDG